MDKIIISFPNREDKQMIRTITITKARSTLNHGSEQYLVVAHDDSDNSFVVYSSLLHFFDILSLELK